MKDRKLVAESEVLERQLPLSAEERSNGAQELRTASSIAGDLLNWRHKTQRFREGRVIGRDNRLIASGQLPAIRIGSSVRVRRGLVDQLEAAARTQA